jgi:hypothetical protein
MIDRQSDFICYFVEYPIDQVSVSTNGSVFHLWPKHLYLAYYKLVVVSYCQTNSYHTQNQNHYCIFNNPQALLLLKRYRLHLTKFMSSSNSATFLLL